MAVWHQLHEQSNRNPEFQRTENGAAYKAGGILLSYHIKLSTSINHAVKITQAFRRVVDVQYPGGILCRSKALKD